MVLKVSSNPNHPGILHFHDSSAPSHKLWGSPPAMDRNEHPILNIGTLILEWTFHLCLPGLLQSPTKREVKEPKE